MVTNVHLRIVRDSLPRPSQVTAQQVDLLYVLYMAADTYLKLPTEKNPADKKIVTDAVAKLWAGGIDLHPLHDMRDYCEALKQVFDEGYAQLLGQR